ncbi:hypothetical protein V8E51_008257 [Hyaloscypha variabilis]
MASTGTLTDGLTHYSSCKAYTSIFQQFNERLPRYNTINGEIFEKTFVILKHVNTDDDFKNEEIRWLAELLSWEQKFPNEKNLFPGIRPRLVEDQIKLANNGAQDCAYCARENLDINACLLNRVFSCGSQGHPKFIIRYGQELARQELEIKELERQDIESEEKERKAAEHKELIKQIESKEIKCSELLKAL